MPVPEPMLNAVLYIWGTVAAVGALYIAASIVVFLRDRPRLDRRAGDPQ